MIPAQSRATSCSLAHQGLHPFRYHPAFIMRPVQAASPRAQVALGSLTQTAARVTGLLVGVALMAYLTRRLGVSDYGRYSVAVVITNWVGITIGLATGGATVRLVSDGASGHRYAAAMIRMTAAFATTVALALGACAGPIASALHEPELAPLLRILAADLVIAATAAVYSGILVAQGRFAMSAAMLLWGSVAQLCSAILFLEQGWSARGACLAIATGSLVQLTIGRVFSGIALFGADRVSFPQLWGETRLLAGAQVALRLSHSLDLPAVKYFVGAAVPVGLYAGANAVCGAAIMLFMPSNGIVLQSLVRSRSQGRSDEAKRTGELFVRGALAYGAVLCGLSVLSDDIAPFLLGSAFSASAPVLSLLLWTIAFRILAVAGRTLIASVGEQGSILAPLTGLVALGVIAYALALPRGGILAAASIALGIAALTAISSLSAGLRLLEIPFPWGAARRIAWATLACAAVAHSLPGAGVLVLGKLTLGCAAYASVLVALGEWRPERNQINALRAAFRRD